VLFFLCMLQLVNGKVFGKDDAGLSLAFHIGFHSGILQSL